MFRCAVPLDGRELADVVGDKTNRERLVVKEFTWRNKSFIIRGYFIVQHSLVKHRACESGAVFTMILKITLSTQRLRITKSSKYIFVHSSCRAYIKSRTATKRQEAARHMNTLCLKWTLECPFHALSWTQAFDVTGMRLSHQRLTNSLISSSPSPYRLASPSLIRVHLVETQKKWMPLARCLLNPN